MNGIDPFLVRLKHFEPFLELYWQFCKEYSTQELAYEAAERQYITVFGERKYSDFESFRQVRNRFLKNKLKNCNKVTPKVP